MEQPLFGVVTTYEFATVHEKILDQKILGHPIPMLLLDLVSSEERLSQCVFGEIVFSVGMIIDQHRRLFAFVDMIRSGDVLVCIVGPKGKHWRGHNEEMYEKRDWSNAHDYVIDGQVTKDQRDAFLAGVERTMAGTLRVMVYFNTEISKRNICEVWQLAPQINRVPG